MSNIKRNFIGYEYKEITVESEYVSMYLDCYENFGWTVDENRPVTDTSSVTGISSIMQNLPVCSGTLKHVPMKYAHWNALKLLLRLCGH